jgi:hypothetical protein
MNLSYLYHAIFIIFNIILSVVLWRGNRCLGDYLRSLTEGCKQSYLIRMGTDIYWWPILFIVLTLCIPTLRICSSNAKCNIFSALLLIELFALLLVITGYHIPYIPIAP